MLVVLLLCLVLFAFLSVARRRMREAYAPILPPVLPGGLPIFGHTLHLVSDTKFVWFLVRKFASNCIKLGGVAHVVIGSEIYYGITDPEDALTVSNSCLQKHFLYTFAKNWLGDGLVTGSGEVYNRHRKLLNPGYSVSMVYGYLEVFNSQARKLASDMDAHSGKGPFVSSSLINRTIMASACSTNFGLNINDKNFLQKYGHATDELMHMVMQRFQKIYLQSNLVYKLLGWQKKEDQLIQTINELTNTVIEQKRAAMKKGGISHGSEEIRNKPYIDFLIELSIDGLLTDKEIRDEVNTNVSAAYDTSSSTLESIAILLGAYPKVQEKLYEELMQVLGADKDVEKDDLQKLVYTKAVIKESLRVLPAVPAVMRFIDKEVELKNYTLRANTQCAILNVGMHLHPVWGPDAELFKPERWLDPATLPTNANYFAGFSNGRRSCVGRSYGMVLLTVALAHLVRRYQWTSDVTKLEMKMDVTLKPASGQEISIQRRKR